MSKSVIKQLRDIGRLLHLECGSTACYYRGEGGDYGQRASWTSCMCEPDEAIRALHARLESAERRVQELECALRRVDGYLCDVGERVRQTAERESISDERAAIRTALAAQPAAPAPAQPPASAWDGSAGSFDAAARNYGRGVDLDNPVAAGLHDHCNKVLTEVLALAQAARRAGLVP